MSTTAAPLLSRDDYSVDVIDGNHGPWLFVRRDGQVICELPGCSSVASAEEIGQQIVTADIERRAFQARCDHHFQPSELLPGVEICSRCRLDRSAS